MAEQVLAVIPARGGSKGIPRKNMADLGGRPLVAWSIAAARAAHRVNRVVVSTDDQEIAETSRAWGAQVLSRPAAISGDASPSEAAILHALDMLAAAESYEPDLVVFLQPTSPLRTPADVDGALRTFLDERADSLFSARLVEGFVWRSDASGARPLTYSPDRRPRRQDIDHRIVEENGSIYVLRPQNLRRLGARLGGRIAVYAMDAIRSFQVDGADDLDLIRRILRAGLAQWPGGAEAPG